MLDLSWGEIVLIGAAAVIFIGPKELPGALRSMGKFMGKARTMAREFQNNIDDMIREAELEEVKKQVQTAQNVATGGLSGLTGAIQNAIDPKGDIQKAIAPPEALSAPSIAAPSIAAPPVAEPAPAVPASPAPTPAPAAVAPSEPPAPAAAAAKTN
ncbi:MAG: twin-arginine translocase subunit TatB [Proteobacteria bacterium]|nr:twin-arginine translocase subunit TatB [Pseudomonadota bacterium]